MRKSRNLDRRQIALDLEPRRPTPFPATPNAKGDQESVVVRFAGDSGDGVQLLGSQFSQETALAGNSLATSTPQLQHVIGETDSAESDRHKYRHPHIRITDISEKDRRDDAGRNYQQPAHSRSAGFFLMRLRHFVANGLADMRSAKALDENRPRGQRECECGETRHHRAKSFVAQNAKADVMSVQRVEQQIEHQIRTVRIAQRRTLSERRSDSRSGFRFSPPKTM